MVDGESILCNTNDDINAVIVSKYSTMQDQSAKFFALLINTNDLQLAGGKWLVLMYRATVNHGFLIATRYTATHPTIYTKSLYSGSWTDFYSIAFDTPPTWYDLPMPDGWEGTLRYAKNQSGTIFVFLSCQTTTSPGVIDFAIGTLPEGYRPAFNITNTGIDVATGTLMTIVISLNGRVVLRPYTGTDMGSWRGTRGCVVFPVP